MVIQAQPRLIRAIFTSCGSQRDDRSQHATLQLERSSGLRVACYVCQGHTSMFQMWAAAIHSHAGPIGPGPGLLACYQHRLPALHQARTWHCPVTRTY